MIKMRPGAYFISWLRSVTRRVMSSFACLRSQDSQAMWGSTARSSRTRIRICPSLRFSNPNVAGKTLVQFHKQIKGLGENSKPSSYGILDHSPHYSPHQSPTKRKGLDRSEPLRLLPGLLLQSRRYLNNLFRTVHKLIVLRLYIRL
jgi:hypothetical protein